MMYYEDGCYVDFQSEIIPSWLHLPKSSKAYYIPSDGFIDPVVFTSIYQSFAKQQGNNLQIEKAWCFLGKPFKFSEGHQTFTRLLCIKNKYYIGQTDCGQASKCSNHLIYLFRMTLIGNPFFLGVK